VSSASSWRRPVSQFRGAGAANTAGSGEDSVPGRRQ
jgi:hypothetical protein